MGKRKLAKINLSVVIIAKNEEKLIGRAIKSVSWADEVVVLDTGSVDKTPRIARKLGARVVKMPTTRLAFSRWRTAGIKHARGRWVFYLDADEECLPALKKEMKKITSSSPKERKNGQLVTAYAIPRENFYLGKRVRWGGAWPDYVKRLFWKETLKRWRGKLHEEPVFKGEMGLLESPMRHYTHRDLTSMLNKTIGWSQLEAEALYEAGHPPMTWWRFFRIMLTELWERGIKKQGFRDGTVGVIEVIFQMFSRFVTYARLWELQQINSKS